jgi:hypothetical protein
MWSKKGGTSALNIGGVQACRKAKRVSNLGQALLIDWVSPTPSTKTVLILGISL